MTERRTGGNALLCRISPKVSSNRSRFYMRIQAGAQKTCAHASSATKGFIFISNAVIIIFENKMSSHYCNSITRMIQDSVSAAPEFMNRPGKIRIRTHLFKKAKEKILRRIQGGASTGGNGIIRLTGGCAFCRQWKIRIRCANCGAGETRDG